MAVANGTLVGVPDGTRPIEEIAVGDMVLASGQPLQWSPLGVAVSEGTGLGVGPLKMVYVAWSDGEILASPDHLMVLEGIVPKRADALIRGDQLLAADGTTVTVTIAALGEWKGSTHALATKARWDPISLTGRFLITAGIITGDMVLQRYFVPKPESMIGTAPTTDAPDTLSDL